jgi:hypothetical protein
MASLSPRPDQSRLGCLAATVTGRRITEVGAQKLAFGRLRVVSEVTREQDLSAFAVLHFGGHHLSAWISHNTDDAALAAAGDKAEKAFLWGDVAEAIRAVQEFFHDRGYTFGHVLRDGQRRILSSVIGESVERLVPMLADSLERCYSSARAMREVGMSPSRDLAVPLAVMFNTAFRRLLEQPVLELNRLALLAKEFRPGVIEPERDVLGLEASRAIERLVTELAEDGEPGVSDEPLDHAIRLFEILSGLRLPLDLWRSQNLFFPLVTSVYPVLRRSAGAGDSAAADRAGRFERLAAYLGIRTG